jgi:hypothetical protein
MYHVEDIVEARYPLGFLGVETCYSEDCWRIYFLRISWMFQKIRVVTQEGRRETYKSSHQQYQPTPA